jgi:RNA polymerase sigma-70 factor, ECF subfamily
MGPVPVPADADVLVDERAPTVAHTQSELEQALAELGPSIYRVAYSVVRDAALAEDAAQETMIRVWTNIGRFRGDSSLRVWVLRIAHNVSISMLRKRRDRVTDPHDLSEEAPPSGGPDRAAEGRAMISDLWQSLDELDPLSRSVVVLREVELMSYEDIADALDIPLPTVKTRLFRARRQLASKLEAWR